MDHTTQQLTNSPSDNLMKITTSQFTSNLINQIHQNISSNIQSSLLSISQEQKKLIITKQPAENHGTQAIVDQKKLAEIMRKRKQLDIEMKRLKYQQKLQKQKSKKSSPTSHRMTKSTFSKQDLKNIHKIKKSIDNFQSKIQAINKQLQDKIKLEKQKKQQQIKRQIQMQHQRRQRRLEKSLQTIKERKVQRQKQINQHNRLLKKVKAQKCLYQQIQEEWKNNQLQLERQQKKMLLKQKEQRKFKFQQIMQHQKKYQSIARDQSHQRSVKTSRVKLQLSRFTQQYMTNHKPSKFFQTISQVQKVQRQQEQQKIKEYRQFIKKRMSYAQKLRQVNKNKESYKSPQKLKKEGNLQQNKHRAQSMSSIEIYKKGNQYMKEIHSQIKHIQQGNQNHVSNPSRLNQTSSTHMSQKIKYRNYLQEEKTKRLSTISLNTIKQKRVSKNPQDNEDIKELKRLMHKNQNKTDKLYKAKMLAKKLDEKSVGNTNALICSIAAKLQIINQFV